MGVADTAVVGRRLCLLSLQGRVLLLLLVGVGALV